MRTREGGSATASGRSPASKIAAVTALVIVGVAGLVVYSPSVNAQANGEEIYRIAGCGGCHGMNGEGGTGDTAGPALANNPHLDESLTVIRMILSGSDLMPPFADRLTDRDVAAVATFIRANWGNAFPPIEADAVAALRTVVAPPGGMLPPG
jgi:mono/diheme cytochrome c family protein